MRMKNKLRVPLYIEILSEMAKDKLPNQIIGKFAFKSFKVINYTYLK